MDARPEPPPLLAFTASKLKPKLDRNGRKEKIPSRIKPGVSKTWNSNANALPRPRFRKPEGAILFDDSSRREYLTGFHKRKQAKITKGKEKAKERTKNELKVMRQEMREARKKQAAENVEAEKKAYRADEEDEDEEYEGSEESETEKVPPLPSAFDTEQHHTTITVQDWDPEGTEIKPKEAPKKKVVKESLPPSSRRMAKKLKSGKGFEEVKEISKLMESEEDLPALEEDTTFRENANDEEQPTKGQNDKGYASYGKTKKVRKPTFRYESKMERAKNKAEARQSKAKWAEKRKEERIGGGGKNRLQKNKGKRGHGGKGKKKATK